MDCNKAKKRLKAYLDRALPDKEAQALQAHIQNCPHCAQETAVLSRAWDILLELPEPEIIPDLLPETLARIRSLQKESLWEKLSRWLTLIPGPAAAATALALGLYFGTSIGTSISQIYSTPQEQEDPLYLEIFNDVPPQSIGDAYLSITKGKEG